jgi:tetratricopeptide (TPR) repeat protein
LATRLFRRTLEVNPNFVEARVRLARLLEEDGRPEEATAQLTQVFAAQPSRADGVVAFYAHLFATRADEFQGRLPSAAEHSRAALALYPRAQSALLMSSHVALRAGNAVDVEASLQRLADASTGDGGNDPWRVYGRGPGRDAAALMSELWVAVGKDGGAPTVK